MNLPVLYLKKKEERRILAGHPWVYSNEVDAARSPLPQFEPGAPAQLRAYNDKVLGIGYVNPHTLICARLVSRRPQDVLGPALIGQRLRRALDLRERLFQRPYYRLVFGESDGLPGLVVDRYGELLVAQIGTAGLDRLKGAVVDGLCEVLRPACVVLRNDAGSRALEGLERYVETPLGEPPQWWDLEENGARFRFSPLQGQKTGWFWDHRQNRARLPAYARGRRVLDVFSYTGAWGIQAALHGAREVLCVDASAEALDQVAMNAGLNGVRERVATLRGDAFAVLKELRDAGEQFDVVVVDPPAFIKRKKDMRAGVEAYQRLNQLALRLLGKDGLLLSSSCSSRLPRETLAALLYRGARHHDRSLQILEHGHQGPDHPIHPALPETDYLKCIMARVFME